MKQKDQKQKAPQPDPETPQPPNQQEQPHGPLSSTLREIIDDTDKHGSEKPSQDASGKAPPDAGHEP